MDRVNRDFFMLGIVFAVVFVTLPLWGVEIVRHFRAVLSAMRNRTSYGLDEVEDDEPGFDPYFHCRNDEEIL